MKKYLSSFVVGFGAGVLQVVPVAKSFACCIIIPLAAYFALMLDQKANKNINVIMPVSRALIIGLLTGIYAALFGSFFDILITFITKNNDIIAVFPEFQKMITNFPISEGLQKEVLNLYSSVIDQIKDVGFSALYTLSILFNNLIINLIFGLIGGVVGVQIINSRIKKSNEL
ncbi:MAG: hypothetical protein KJ571_02200 [Bacteroidetes bacterium]|nr:hypothetical protein [Bacteroidota bacterium]